MTRGRCWACGEMGHWADECPGAQMADDNIDIDRRTAPAVGAPVGGATGSEVQLQWARGRASGRLNTTISSMPCTGCRCTRWRAVGRGH